MRHRLTEQELALKAKLDRLLAVKPMGMMYGFDLEACTVELRINEATSPKQVADVCHKMLMADFELTDTFWPADPNVDLIMRFK